MKVGMPVFHDATSTLVDFFNNVRGSISTPGFDIYSGFEMFSHFQMRSLEFPVQTESRLTTEENPHQSSSSGQDRCSRYWLRRRRLAIII
ncbi:hypothetical protein TNCV_1013141 [Trichonephila clavipes]|uniref:Uncharacterized protein n=1 Tax=Trichonephila clavipes TaxID=2585209 RepID=A0A8X6VXK5_TRICX|nr:hypothetical protein TNCV_1013141 [Trichonephila clavipes]